MLKKDHKTAGTGKGPRNQPWFRFHHKLLNDPVVQGLEDKTFKTYINLLCLAASVDEDGTLGNKKAVSFALRTDVTSCFTALHKVGLIEPIVTDGETLHETFQIPQWNKMQYKSDTSTMRVQKLRAKKRLQKTLHGNVTETQSGTPQIRADQSREDKPFQQAETVLSDVDKSTPDDGYIHVKKFKYTLDQNALATSMSCPVKQRFSSQDINLDAWSDDVRKLIEIDKHSIDDIQNIWSWIQNHQHGNFSWADQIRTPAKLRQKKEGLSYYDKISHQIKQGDTYGNYQNTNQPKQSLCERAEGQAAAIWSECEAEEAGKHAMGEDDSIISGPLG